MRKLFYFICLSFSTVAFSQSYSGRYANQLFTNVDILEDVTYGSAPVWTVPYNNKDLKMDIYQPQGDTLSKRPVIIFAHAGGFLNGDKQVDDMVALCDSFARKGFVTATINYRMGFNPLDGESAERAVYRGVQDGKAAVRYFKEHRDLYRIDTNYVFFGGMSAGGYMSQFVGYMDKESDRPASTYGGGLVNDLGCLDCAGNSYNVSSKVRAILGYWGAVQDTTMIEAGEVPALLMHGENDPTVPYDYGNAFGLGTLPPTFGSYSIQKRMDNVGIYNEFYKSSSNLHMLDGSSNGTFPASGPNDFWYDTLLPRTTDFLYRMIQPKPERISPNSFVLCENDEFNLEILPDYEPGHVWMVPAEIDLISASANGIFHAPQQGNYQIGYIEINPLLAVSDTIWFDITVKPSPVLTLSADVEEICLGKSANLWTTGADYYTWNEGLLVGSTQTVSPIETTTYEATAHFSNGCTTTASIQIVVNDCVGVEEATATTFSVYPNPANDWIKIDTKENEIIRYQLIDMTGKIIQTNKVNDSVFYLTVKNLNEGMYVLQLISNKKVLTASLKVER